MTEVELGQAATDFPGSLAAGTQWIRLGVNSHQRFGTGRTGAGVRIRPDGDLVAAYTFSMFTA